MDDTFEQDPGVQWMLAYQAGSEEGFDRLVETYSGQVYALLTRFLGPVAEREDLVQEVFLRVIRSRERYQPAARFSTFLYRIVFNLSVNQTERAKGELSLPPEGTSRRSDAGSHRSGSTSSRSGSTSASSQHRADQAFDVRDPRAASPSAGLEEGDVVHAVRAAIAALPEAQRMALILAKYEELTFAEIAVVLGSSEKAIKSLVHRARETLRERLAPFLQQELA